MTLSLDDYKFEPNLAAAFTLPSRWYTFPEFLEAEKEKIFARTWQAVARTADLQRPGDFVACELTGEPLVITRGTDNILRGFFNVCRHRAGQVASGKGNRKSLQCQYHGWTYNLEGKLMKTPEFEGVENFEPADFCLQAVRVETWGPLVFVNLDAQAESLAGMFGEIMPETKHIALEKMSLVERRDYVVKSNWKVYVDNYLEGYHIPIAHPGLFRMVDYDQYKVETRQFHSLQHSPLRPARGAAKPPYADLEADANVLYYWVFPNLMLNLYPDNISINIILPIDQETTLTIFEWYFLEGGSGEAWETLQQGIAFSDQVQLEDIEICQAVQRGLRSRAYTQGRFSVKRENGVHHFHSLVHEFLKRP
ncbi:MAG: Rieske 2Fe-2S domain-containing protein [Chloroflexi bacterium]|nr:Rieske 2Fe-2S domain-containing protein [Chloroflexota bacterium]